MQIMLKDTRNLQHDHRFGPRPSEPQSRTAVACAALLVRTLHVDLLSFCPAEKSSTDAVRRTGHDIARSNAGRDWLFADNNYHIDVSHLHSTVRFARSLSPGQPELVLARDLAEYGMQLSTQFQYAGEPPLATSIPRIFSFLKFLANEDRDQALAYFQQQLDKTADSPDSPDQAMIAYVMVDLLARTDQLDAALPLAEKYLVKADQDFAAAFAELCQKAGRLTS